MAHLFVHVTDNRKVDGPFVGCIAGGVSSSGFCVLSKTGVPAALAWSKQVRALEALSVPSLVRFSPACGRAPYKCLFCRAVPEISVRSPSPGVGRAENQHPRQLCLELLLVSLQDGLSPVSRELVHSCTTASLRSVPSPMSLADRL